jgi:hypothetical protein
VQAPIDIRLSDVSIACLVFSFFLSTGCSTLVKPTQGGGATESRDRCVPPMAKRAQRPITVSSLEARVLPTPLAKLRFSTEAFRVADTMGAVSLLNDIALLSEKGSYESVELLVKRQRLTDRILLTLLEVGSATAEIVCERDRADQLADRMEEIDGARIKGLTIASIVISGVTSIVTGEVSLAGGATTAGDAANVGGGILASGFGVAALFTHSEVEFRHERNILREVWADPKETEIFSSIVWRYLHRVDESTDEDPRQAVINAWRQKGRLGEQSSDDERKREFLFFGSGGRYTASELRARASMLETLEAALRLLHEELEIMIREVTTADIEGF